MDELTRLQKSVYYVESGLGGEGLLRMIYQGDLRGRCVGVKYVTELAFFFEFGGLDSFLFSFVGHDCTWETTDGVDQGLEMANKAG